MKKIILLSLLLSICTFNLSRADILTRPKNNKEFKDAPKIVFTSYPIAFFGSSLKVGFEFYVPNNKSINIVTSYSGSEYSNIYSVGNYFNFMAEAQFRFYLNKLGKNPPLNGIYVSPFLLFGTASYVNSIHTPIPNPERMKASTFGVGYYIGYQKIFPVGISFGFYGGGGIMAPTGDYDALDMEVNPYSKGVKPRGGITVGFAF
jgi:hypothetical protein